MTPRTVLAPLIATLTATALLALPDSCSISLGDTALPPKAVASLRTLAARLEATTRPVTTKPDLVLTVEDTTTGTEELLTVWFDDHFLYRGEYLDAWRERMTSDSAVGYRLNAEIERVLRQLRTSNPDEEP